MDGYQPKVSLETQTVTCRNIRPVNPGNLFVKPLAKIIHGSGNLIICKVTPATNTRADIAQAKFAF